MGQLVLKTKKTLYPAFNMLSGVLIRLFTPFKKGDFIEINGQLGSVEHKGYKSTILKNIEGEKVQIANTLFYTGELHNLSSQNIVNVDMTISVDISANMIKVKQLISEFLLQERHLLNAPSHKLFVRKIKDKYVELGVIAWCDIEKYLEVDSEVEMFLKRHLIENGVCLEMPNSERINLMTA